MVYRTVMPQDCKDPVDRFWKRVSKGSEDDCWNYLGRPKNGYGTISSGPRGSRVEEYAHRFSYALHKGEIPFGLQVLHSCDNRKCVNPKHLFPGTIQDNMKDKVIKGRHVKGEIHYRAILSEEDVLEIRRLHVPWVVSFADLAKQFNVSHATIYAILHRKNWKHI